MEEDQAYSIACGKAYIGKIMSVSKVRYWWTFAFGQSGFHRHVELIVSVSSGKRLIVLDGKEVHSETSKSVFVFNWSQAIDATHIIQIKGIDSANFDFLVDSIRFTLLPKKAQHNANLTLEQTSPSTIHAAPSTASPLSFDLLTGDGHESQPPPATNNYTREPNPFGHPNNDLSRPATSLDIFV